MNWPHLHLILNHVPVLGTVFGFALLAWALMRRDETLQRAALATFVVVALAAIPVFLTGEPSEEAVEQLTGTAKSAIESHEEAALVALIAVEGLGLLALATLLLFRKRPVPRPLAGVALVAALATAGWMAQTANLGGRIRHPEIRQAVAPAGQEHEQGPKHERTEGR